MLQGHGSYDGRAAPGPRCRREVRQPAGRTGLLYGCGIVELGVHRAAVGLVIDRLQRSDCGLPALLAAHLERQKDVGEAPEQREEPDPDQQQ